MPAPIEEINGILNKVMMLANRVGVTVVAVVENPQNTAETYAYVNTVDNGVVSELVEGILDDLEALPGDWFDVE